MTGLVRLLALGFLALQIGGCATAINGTTQQVAFDTPGVERAACTLQNRSIDNAYRVLTPTVIQVPRSGGDLNIACEKDGYHPAYGHVPSSFTGTTIGNVLVGGLIGVAVDAASGANNRYPRNIYIHMTKIGEERPNHAPDSAPGGDRYDVVAYAPGDPRNHAAWTPRTYSPPAPAVVTEPDAESQDDIFDDDGLPMEARLAELRAERDAALANAAAWDRKADEIIQGSQGSTNDAVYATDGGQRRSERWLAALREASTARDRAARIDARIRKLETRASSDATAKS